MEDITGSESVPPHLALTANSIRMLVLTLDGIGTFVFPLSGAAAGIRARLDLFGVLVRSLAAATSGGIIRDMLIGSVASAAIKQSWYLGVSLAAGITMFYWHPNFNRLRNTIWYLMRQVWLFLQ